MTWIALCSAKGSPGVTTLACALGAVWPGSDRVVVAECDPGGGDIAGRFGLSARTGMTSFVMAARHAAQRSATPPALTEHLQILHGGLGVLVGPPGADAASALDHELNAAISFMDSNIDLVLDCGRLQAGSAGQQAIISMAQRVLILVRPEPADIAHVRAFMDRLKRRVPELDAASRREPVASADPPVDLVLCGTGTVTPQEASGALGLPVLGVVPDDPAGAKVMSGRPAPRRSARNSPLVRSASNLLEGLQLSRDLEHLHNEGSEDEYGNQVHGIVSNIALTDVALPGVGPLSGIGPRSEVEKLNPVVSLGA